MFIAAFFKAKKWGKSKNPSTDDGIYKMCQLHSVTLFIKEKIKELVIHATTWLNLENLMLSKGT
jgi:hypothetical protein